jgi:hypothetical protein
MMYGIYIIHEILVDARRRLYRLRADDAGA